MVEKIHIKAYETSQNTDSDMGRFLIIDKVLHKKIDQN